MSVRAVPETGARLAPTIARPRVMRLLDVAATRPVVLVEAPAGYGKTIAVRQWLASSTGGGVAWVDLRRVSGRPRAFVEDLLRQVAQVLGRPPTDDRRTAAAVDDRFDEGLAALQQGPGDVTIVLDGLDVADDTTPLVRRLVQHLPAHWRVVITARTTPAIGAARLRSALALGEIGPIDLRFDLAEVRTLFRGGLGLDLGDRVIEDVTERLGGWAAGLTLVGLGASREPDPEPALAGITGEHPWIDAYLMAEVLPGLDGDLRRFLVETAPLTRLSVELCNHVTGRRDALVHLETLRSWPMVSTEHTPTGVWLRHDEVFGTWLRLVAGRTSLEAVHAVEGTAARWCLDRGLLDDALAYAVAAGDGGLTAEILGAHGYALLRRDAQLVLDALDILPARLLDQAPGYWLLGADAAGGRGDAVRATLLTERAREGADAMEGSRARGLRRGIAVFEVLWFLRHGHVSQASQAVVDLMATTGPRPPGVVMHAGWDQGRARTLGDLTAYLAGAQHARHSMAVRALLACHRRDDVTARVLSRQVVASAPAHAGDGSELLAAALALSWSGTAAEAMQAHELVADRATRDRWWLTDVLEELLNVESARREHRWRTVRQHLDQAQRLLDDVPDPGVAPERLLAHAIDRIDDDVTTAVTTLTEREVDVLRQLVADRSRGEVARRLRISPNTVKTHLRSAFRKLGVESRAEAIARAQEMGLLEASPSGAASSDESSADEEPTAPWVGRALTPRG